ADAEAVAALGAAAGEDAAAGLRRHARAEAVLVGALAAAGLVGALHRSGEGAGARGASIRSRPGTVAGARTGRAAASGARYGAPPRRPPTLHELTLTSGAPAP